MLAEFVDKIVSLRKTEIFNIAGSDFSDRPLVRVPDPPLDLPDVLKVNSLDSLVKLVRNEVLGKHVVDGDILFLQVESPTSVKAFSSYGKRYSRKYFYSAVCSVPGFYEGFRSQEEAIIQLRSLFSPDEGSEYLLGILSKISNENSVTSSDNGVTQTVNVRSGVALAENATLNPRVTLRPFRTFLEVEQPESEFLVRLDDKGRIGLFEADGGVWKLFAKRNIAEYLQNELKDLVQSGDVIVME